MTTEEIEVKAAELSTREGVKVYPMVFPNGDTTVVGFLREPARMTKIRVMDKAIREPISAAYELFEAALMRADSDPIFTSDRSEDDPFVLGAVMAAYGLVVMADNTYKKK